jgi:molybdenum cofactor synthesis domain-containing protein
MKKISADEACGLILAYDITEVSLEKKLKKRAFKRGHIITADDIEYMKNLGRRNIYVMDGIDTDIHEDDAAKTVAPLAAGEFISYDKEPSEGKISFYAETDGVFHVDRQRLLAVNSLEIPSLPTLHDGYPVKKGAQVAAFRIIPLVCSEQIITEIKNILKTPLLSVSPYKIKTAAILVTGNEVYEGRIKDGFVPRLTAKLKTWGVEVTATAVSPDEQETIVRELNNLESKAEMVLTTGGTSVDPDDVTADAIISAGVKLVSKGNPIQPGNNCSVGYIGDKPVICVPAAALFFHATALDIYMPKILAGEKITKEFIASSGHGGLCHFCEKCHYPVCPFGRGGLC